MDLAEIKKVSLLDLKSFLAEDHTNFSVLNVRLKSILSTGRTSVTLSKNSAKSFYLNQPKSPSLPNKTKVLKDDCLTDAQNCEYFQFFNRKEKKLYTRFLDKVEANFEGKEAQKPLLFLTLTFNTTQANLFTFTTNTKPDHPCWEPISKKNDWLKDWAQKFDENAEPMLIQLKKVAKEEANNFATANHYLSKFLRNIRLKWKPRKWKWVVVAELQKRGVWHFHLLSTPIVPYAHKCTLSKDFTACWNCRTYLSELWPYGRVESRSPGQKTISKYLAKYLAKSFHLRDLYHQHGFGEHNKAYRFFKNVYDYEQREAIIQGKTKLDKLTGKCLNGNQKIFRQSSNNGYYYRTKEKLVATVVNPLRLSKNYRLGTHSLKTLELLNLAKKSNKKETILLQKANLKQQTLNHDFQTFLITHLLIVAAILCLVLYYYRDKLNAKKTTEYLPIIGGLAFGLNTLITIAKN